MAGRRPALGRISSENGGRMSSASSKPLPAILNRKRKNDQEDPTQPVRNCDKSQFQIIHLFLLAQSIWIQILSGVFLRTCTTTSRQAARTRWWRTCKASHSQVFLGGHSTPGEISSSILTKSQVFIYFSPQSCSTFDPVDKLRQRGGGYVHGVVQHHVEQRGRLCLEVAWQQTPL